MKKLITSICLAAILWFIIFVVRPTNFWLMMAAATTLLTAITFALGRPLFGDGDFSAKNILIGIVSAALLWAIFAIGGEVIGMIFPRKSEFVNMVYANRGGLSPITIGLLLFFPIGFGEEIFWRGYVQKKFATKFGDSRGLIIATLIYSAIHIPTLNPVLLLAAAVGGLFWGALYMRTKSLTAVLVSHMIWDPLIFVIFPVN